MLLLMAAILGNEELALGPDPKLPARIQVILDPDAPTSDIVLGNSDPNFTATYDLCARNSRGPVLLEDFGLLNCVAELDADGDCADPGEEWGDDSSIDSVTIWYTDTDGNETSETGFLAGGYVVYSNLDLLVPNCREGSAQVRVSVATTVADDTPGGSGTPGDVFQLNWWAPTGFSAYEVLTGATVSLITPSVTSEPMTYHKSKPVYALSSGSPKGSSPVGLIEVLRTKLEANSRGDITEKGKLFYVDSRDKAGSGWNTCLNLADDTWWTYYNSDDQSDPLDSYGTWTFYSVDGTPCADAPDAVLGYAFLEVEIEMAAGTTNTFILKIDVTGASAGLNDSIAAGIVQQEEAELYGLDAIWWLDGSYPKVYNADLVSITADGWTIWF